LLEDPRWAPSPALDTLVGYFLGACPEAMGVVVVGPNGIPMASSLPRQERVQLIAVTAMANLATWAGSAVAANLLLPGMSGVTIEGPTWRVILAPTPSHSAAVLVMIDDSSDVAEVQKALPAFLRDVDRSLGASTE